jgi:hypothetical protein
VPYFLENKSFRDFISNLRTLYRLKKSGYLDYQISGDRKKTYRIKPNDYDYIGDLLYGYDTSECMKTMLGVGSVLNHTIQNFFAFFSKIRMGKTIYRTDYVETINQHSADVISPGTKKVQVPIDLGFASHVRNYIAGLFDTDIDPIRFVIFDKELFWSTTLPFDPKCQAN